MAITIRTKEKCPVCGQPFTHIKPLGFICRDCKTVPRRFFIDLHFNNARHKLYSDKDGHVLDSYSRVEELLKTINYEMKHFTFDPSKYIKADLENFWTCNLLDSFLKVKENEVAPSYQKDYRRMVGIARSYFKTRDVREIRKLHLSNFKQYCEENHQWSPKTLKNTMDLFRAFLGYVKNDLEIISNIPPFPEIVVPDRPFKWLSAEDQLNLFEKVPDTDKPIIAFLMLHGCRPGEARALRCRHINLETMTLTIQATFSINVYREKRKGKYSKSIVVPIHPEMLAFLRERVEGSTPEAFVFINPRNGLPYSSSAVGRIWNNVRDAAGIRGKDLRLYDASRHSFASQLVNAGTSLFTVSKLLGHSSTKMTEKYAHGDIDSMRTELGKITLKAVPTLSPKIKQQKK